MAALHARQRWKRYVHRVTGFLSAEIHRRLFPQWFVNNHTLAYRANRAAFIDHRWPRVTWGELRGCLKERGVAASDAL